MSDPVNLPTIQFLAWVASRRRSFADVREAWRSTCPRLSVWEDALGEHLVRCEQSPGKAADDCAVTLTASGRAILEAHDRAEDARRRAAAD